MKIDSQLINVKLLGSVAIEIGASVAPSFPTRKSLALFANLALHPSRKFTRDTLAENLWPDYALHKARKCLRNELWRIRNLLPYDEYIKGPTICVDRRHVWFNSKVNCLLDVREFESKFNLLNTLKSEDHIKQYETLLQECLTLYQGDLLESLAEHWVILRREELKTHYLNLRELAMKHYMFTNRWENALEHGRRLLLDDPLLEHVHYRMMKCHIARENRSAAIMQYQICRTALRDELGVSPMPEIENLYRRIISRQEMTLSEQESLPKTKAGVSRSIAESIQQAIQNVSATEKALLHARDQLI